MKHILNTQIPLSKSQLSRIYYAAKGIPDPKGGQEYDLEKELPGLMGWRQIKIDPIRGLGFRITNYNAQKRNATREFTGGDSRLLSGGLNKPEEIARQFFIANRALFNAQQSMHLDLKAANEFEIEDEQLAQVFDERGTPANVYGPFFEGIFRPYIPSENIVNKFNQIDQKNNTNAMEQALPIISNDTSFSKCTFR